MQDHGRGRKADVGLDGEASWRIRILATSAIPKRRKGKTRGVASNRWQIYEAQLGPITRAAAWLRLNVCLWHLADMKTVLGMSAFERKADIDGADLNVCK